MTGRNSIGRLMISMLFISVALTVTQSWVREERWPGETGPMLIMALVAMAVAILAGSRLRKFCLGMASVGLALPFAFEWTPGEFRHWVETSWVLPIEKIVLGDRSHLNMFTEEGSRYFSFKSSPSGAKFGVISGPYRESENQFTRALIQLPVALVGGMLASIDWRKSRTSDPSRKPRAWS